MATLQYQIDVIGVRAVDQAFAHVEARARRANRAMMLGAQQAASVTGIRGGVAARVGSTARGARTAAMSQAQIEAEVAKKSAALKEKLAARTAARIAKIETQMAAKTAAEKEALERRAEAARVRHAQRLARIEAASRARMAASTAKEEARAAMRESARAARAKEQEARAELSRLRAMNAAQVASRTRFGSAVGQAAIGGVTSVGKAAIGAAAIGGTALLGNALYTQSQESFRARQLANQAGTPERFNEILSGAQQIQGFTGMEALNALGSWTDLTGDLKAGEGILKELGATALATSTNMDELAAAAGNAFIPLNDSIPDADERMKALKTTIRAMAGMGAVGAVEIKDLASEMAGLAAQATKFEGGAEQVMRQSVAMAQTARQRGGASSAAEAVTSVARFGSDVLTKQSDLRAMGVEVFTDKSHTQLRSQKAIMADVLEKSGGDLGKIGEIFGERSIRAVQGFSPLYTMAEKKKKGSGRAAVMAEFDRLEKATLSDDAVKERMASIMESPSMQFKETMKQINAKLGTEMLPVFVDLVKAFKDALPAIIDFGKGAAHATGAIVGWASKNPFSGMSAILSAAIVKEIAAARISDAISKSIAGGSAMDLKLAGAAIAITAATLTVEKLSNARDEAVNKEAAQRTSTTNLINKVSAEERNKTSFLNWTPEQGAEKLSPETKAAAEKEMARITELKNEAASLGITKGSPQAPEFARGPSGGDLVGGLFGDITNYMGITDPGTTKGSAQVYQHSSEVEKAGRGEMDQDLARLAALLAESGKELKTAASALKDAAKSGVNRGNTPSPVK